MNTITGNLRGRTVNVIINESIFSKKFSTEEQAEDFFRLVSKTSTLDYISDEQVDVIMSELSNKSTASNLVEGFEYNYVTNTYHLEGFDTPVPTDLIKTIEEYIEKDFPVVAIKNFWTRLMANPDKRVRSDLFKFIQTYDFMITNKGYLVVYKTVDYKEKMEHDLAEFVTENYLRIKYRRKQAPAKFVVYAEYETEIETVTYEREVETDEYELEGYASYDEFFEEEGYEPDMIYDIEEYEEEEEVRNFIGYRITEQKIFANWENEVERDIEYIGHLNELQAKVDRIENQSTYTDMYSHTMEIKLGQPVKQQRPDCNGDPKIECSHGLHVGATKYVEAFRNHSRGEAPVLLCLVDPMNVVAVPEYDNSKIRVCEYYPYAKATVSPEGKIDILEQSYFEDDYEAENEIELQKLISAVRDEELEIRMQADNAQADHRSLEEYSRILQARVSNIS